MMQRLKTADWWPDLIAVTWLLLAMVFIGSAFYFAAGGH